MFAIGTRYIVQHVQSLEAYMDPQALPVLISECRARNNPRDGWVCPTH